MCKLTHVFLQCTCGPDLMLYFIYLEISCLVFLSAKPRFISCVLLKKSFTCWISISESIHKTRNWKFCFKLQTKLLLNKLDNTSNSWFLNVDSVQLLPLVSLYSSDISLRWFTASLNNTYKKIQHAKMKSSNEMVSIWSVSKHCSTNLHYLIGNDFSFDGSQYSKNPRIRI